MDSQHEILEVASTFLADAPTPEVDAERTKLKSALATLTATMSDCMRLHSEWISCHTEYLNLHYRLEDQMEHFLAALAPYLTP